MLRLQKKKILEIQPVGFLEENLKVENRTRWRWRHSREEHSGQMLWPRLGNESKATIFSVLSPLGFKWEPACPEGEAAKWGVSAGELWWTELFICSRRWKSLGSESEKLTRLKRISVPTKKKEADDHSKKWLTVLQIKNLQFNFSIVTQFGCNKCRCVTSVLITDVTHL